MNRDELVEYCLGKPGAVETYPFDETTAVFKVKNKIFALSGQGVDPVSVNLKCDPDHAEALRSIYDAVKPGYHMDKRHWNTITFDGSIPDVQIKEMIDHSYELVVSKLSRQDRESLAQTTL